ncbi:MAG: TlyA family RNA methyltransferase [Casimicrobiaceae bacterium]|nr:TlyA family RNA methyltransferase [Casimicrobiaceae bacterium]MDW8312077.1 TlyA family RNA methyltransferase [Burkholderiales bacterium]
MRPSAARADVALVERGLAASRTLARRLIEGGHVHMLCGGQRRSVTRPSEVVPAEARLEVDSAPILDYVSRGGLKLAGALAHLKLDVGGLRCLDVGQSTGGFTDCLLAHGAAQVVGIDVGHGQLHPKLACDPRVIAYEGIHARNLPPELAPGPFDLIVADVSFISLTQVLPICPGRLAPDGRVLALVKPQFEVGRSALGKGGIVRDPARFDEVRQRVCSAAQGLGFDILDYFPSPIAGGDGNREFFLYAQRPIGPAPASPRFSP